MNKNDKKLFRGVKLLNKYTIIILFLYFLLGTGATYAYYAYQVQTEDNIIVGNVVAIDVDLEVELVSGTTNEMVPMMDAALSNAINGVGSTNGACIDSVGNLSCQVYKITLTNNGSRLQHIKGTVKLYAKDGDNNVYSNLKWRELTNATTLKEDAIINGMTKSTLVSDLTIESKEVKVWHIAVWLSEADYDQRNTDKGDFGGTVTFGNSEEIGTEFIEKKLEKNARTDENIDFSKTSAVSGTNGIYLRSGTEDDDNPIYYYRGNVNNNNLIFAETCWKIVRTTETGGLKLIYNGLPSNGECNNTGIASQIGTKKFNSSGDSPAYVGYMYGTVYSVSSKDMSSVTDTYYYGNDVTYSNGTYTLTDTITSSDWSSIYNGGLNSNHYVCINTGATTCSSVNYINYTDSSTAYYITLTGGKKVEDALSEMLDYNTNSSTIKGSSTLAGTLDYWYYNNIELAGYSDYVEDTVWCNDRSIAELSGWNPDVGNTISYLKFSAYNRVYSTNSPTLICSREIDKFTVSEANGNGNLDYSVGLLTADEITLAGGKAGIANSEYYLYTGQNYWGGSPFNFDSNNTQELDVYISGAFGGNYVNNTTIGVRPSISLSPGFSISDGDGTVYNPYVVE